ncbi:hypothetical protein CEXT_150571 [Caerostris extrusa]|uniref:Secreted protein n=1 Tax=Caerostris extrusa TaxID=172846 RepID=A0AAV4QDQ5_CAEEX|nr:hypothetical protein CEXT_150571 [Caerostris extrusa]
MLLSQSIDGSFFFLFVFTLVIGCETLCEEEEEWLKMERTEVPFAYASVNLLHGLNWVQCRENICKPSRTGEKTKNEILREELSGIV